MAFFFTRMYGVGRVPHHLRRGQAAVKLSYELPPRAEI